MKGKEKETSSKLEKLVAKKLKELGVQKEIGQNSAQCEICEKIGHKAAQCWYNPNYRGSMPAGLRQQMADASGVFPEQSKPQQSGGWQRQNNWQNSKRSGRPPFNNNRFCPGGWQNNRPPNNWRGNWNGQPNWQSTPQNWNDQQGWSSQQWNQQGWGQQNPPQQLPQLPAPPGREPDKSNQPVAHLINVVLTEDKESGESALEHMMQCDCLDCLQPEYDAMAITRAKAKL